MLSHVEVDYPTRESILGKAVYLDLMDSASVMPYSKGDANSSIEWIKVDFHKMTVMFAHFFANNAAVTEESQTVLLEFMAQITLDDNPSLYLAFDKGETVTTAIVTESDTELLISDFHKLYTPDSAIDALVSQINPEKNRSLFKLADKFPMSRELPRFFVHRMSSS
ncbi:hypothetical protein JCM19232_476 [Vibrio ishigakensis]|uniref:Uncharacterized protein n=1 Tax=Vibrio ishigakensis TaxID=1481914 RepID=A0A0B8PAD1_9VIBR|nr:hypothetical protein JCM19232_476 [Vibrio ishigakensis]